MLDRKETFLKTWQNANFLGELIIKSLDTKLKLPNVCSKSNHVVLVFSYMYRWLKQVATKYALEPCEIISWEYKEGEQQKEPNKFFKKPNLKFFNTFQMLI